MKLQDIRCPVCGSINFAVDLQETDGLIKCGCCHAESRVVSLRPLTVIPSDAGIKPVFRWNRIAML